MRFQKKGEGRPSDHPFRASTHDAMLPVLDSQIPNSAIQPTTHQARGDPSTDLLWSFCPSDLFILVRLDVALGYPLDGTSCGIWLLHYQHNHAVYARPYLGMAYLQYAASVLAGNTLFRTSCVVVFRSL
jgi:hypothetical protein